MIILVNATALTSGGGLVTLEQFLDNIPLDDKYIFYIFCSDVTLKDKYFQNNIVYIYPKYRTGLSRIYWDMFGLQRWSQKNSIKPELVISLQNTTIRFKNDNIPQISYIMQAIPFVNKKWNFFDKKERTLWFYKNIYPLFMSINLGEKHYVVTQSKWIKSKFANKFNFPLEKIFPIRPIININKTSNKKVFDEEKFIVFCPSSAFVYKNNIEIVNALIYLKSKNQDISRFSIYITFEKDNDIELYKIIMKNNLESNFNFIGRISYDVILTYYNGCDLVVFPSYLETFGLPLLEAASFGKPILCTNEDYAIEVIGDYKGANMLKINSPQLWGENLLKEFKERNSFKNYKADFKESWDDFFQLIKYILTDK
ncbi:glycosyltransferase [Sulfurimonas sp.]|uniref:glycosyltransferase n=1 Tax=Sulfurimonas sp. TaxID=2022749 RepID=UPI003563FBD7